MRGEAPDMSLWNELPGPEIVPSYTSEGNVGRHSSASLAQGTPGHDDDDAWENAISAALAQRSRDAVEDPANMLREQANLIGRLLCVAAAATAATLIPGITVNGSSVSGFGETQAGELLGGTGIPLAHAPASQRTAGSPGTPRPRSDSFGTFRTQGRAAEEGMPTSGANHESGSENVQPPSSALRNILSNALAAAFRSTPSGSTHSNPLSGTADSTRETTSSLLAETSPSTIATSAHSDMIDAPTATPTPDTETETTATSARPPQSRRSLSDPFGHGTALAIPVASLRSGVPYVSGDHHSPGTFERFLADLQAE